MVAERLEQLVTRAPLPHSDTSIRGQRAGAGGVGVTYHPFLHQTLLSRLDEFDFIELPLDLYLEAAWRSLLDPVGARLREISAAKACTWRGTALSLGSVETLDDPTPNAWLVAQIRKLMDLARTEHYTDAIGFRSLGEGDLGFVQRLPYSEVAARWIATRYRAACAKLGHPFMLQLPASTVIAPGGGEDAAAFLRHISIRANCQFVLDAADLACFAAEASVDLGEWVERLPGERIAQIVVSGEREEDWTSLSMLVRQIPVRAVVIRRERNLFPLEAIERDVHRAADLLARGTVRAPPPSVPMDMAASDDAAGLESLRAYQTDLIEYCMDPAPERIPPALLDVPQQSRAALVSRVQSWHTWRERLRDAHNAQQIGQFLAQDAGRRA